MPSQHILVQVLLTAKHSLHAAFEGVAPQRINKLQAVSLDQHVRLSRKALSLEDIDRHGI